MASVGATYEEIARILDIDPGLMSKRMAERGQEFHAYKKGLSDLKTSLRRKQVQLALEGDRTMLIWLGKNILGQTDRREVEYKVDLRMIEMLAIQNNVPVEVLKSEFEKITGQRLIDGGIVTLPMESEFE